jgi:branched-chain amino acid transport system substrate-binding protein
MPAPTVSIPRRAAARLALAGALLAGCASDPPKTPITIGYMVGFEGTDPQDDIEVLAAQLAIESINRLGGVNGHPLELVIKDDYNEPDIAVQKFHEMIDDGVVGTIGGGYSSLTRELYPVARDAEFPFISPWATAPTLASVDDNGFMFRDIPNDSMQSLAMAYYLTSVAKPAITHITVAYEDSLYGSAFVDALEAALTRAGGTIDGRVTFPKDGPTGDPELARKVMDDLDALPTRPSHLLLISLGDDAHAVLQAWNERPEWSGVKWLFTDGARVDVLLEDLPAGCIGSTGTAPTFPTLGDAYGVLKQAFNEHYPMLDVGQDAYVPNVWDAVYLFASALVAQDAAGEPFGGAGLRDRLQQVSKGPGLILHAGQWRDIIGTLRRGYDIDYDGASGPVDFDADGETIGPYEVWEIASDQGQYTYHQMLFLDAKQLIRLQQFSDQPRRASRTTAAAPAARR